jgi:hypothetical protein
MPTSIRYFLIAALLLFSCRRCFSQANIRDSSFTFYMLGATIQYQAPSADMATDFGNNLNFGGFFQIKLKNNWMFGVEGEFLFNDGIKNNNLLSGISTPEGNIIDQDGAFAIVSLQERGFLFSLKAGKLFPVIGPNPNSGILATVAPGFLQHKIRIETKSDVPEISGDYVKGYDHLTNGVALTEFIGYMHCGNTRLINFFAGFEFTQASTMNRRAFNFDTMSKDNSQHLDLLIGIKAGWFFPLYKHAVNTYYYY